ncbi:hypothetical protein DDZ13_06325 [Coraliomargarita sinensis]|uniref:Xylose isomerase-like TIM barrel domain-containing protein n=1 Tax=Coraliomargarita sinensis TaxID=2174842 RepID=A0A317ZH54_9BACT|nr:sugar phosphate isomerase/epimerase [Coraliomargarita sinensis]PXA04780.1 hypothetical protein DDZ13_06325 [Coraliomargarita sinensis]
MNKLIQTLTLLCLLCTLSAGSTRAAEKKASVTGLSGPALAWWCFSNDGGAGLFSLDEMIAIAKEHEMAIDIPPHKYVETIQDAGVAVPCLVKEIPDLPPFVLSPGNPAEREQVTKALKDTIDHASKHDVPMVICFTGNKAVDLSFSRQFDNLVAAYRDLTAYAKSKQVRLVLECLNDNFFAGEGGAMKGHPGYFGTNPWVCLDLVEEVGEPEWFGLALDWYHLGVEDYAFGHGNSQDMSVFIEKAKDYIIHTHVAGVYADEKLMRGPLHLQGQKVDFPRIYQELGLEVPYTLEFPVYGGKGDAPAARESIAEAIKLME